MYYDMMTSKMTEGSFLKILIWGTETPPETVAVLEN